MTIRNESAPGGDGGTRRSIQQQHAHRSPGHARDQAERAQSWPRIQPNLRRAELETLRRHRIAAGQSTETIDAVITSGAWRALDGRKLGSAVRFTFEEYRTIGQVTHRHVATLRPYDATARE